MYPTLHKQATPHHLTCLFEVFYPLCGTAPVCVTVAGLLALNMPAVQIALVWMSALQGDQIMLVTEFMSRGSLSWEALSNIDNPGAWWHCHSYSGVWYER